MKVRRPLVMGILNATPDSFSDGGLLQDAERRDRHIRALIDGGADLLDIGGESTRPGHEPVAARDEIERVLPVIKAARTFDAGIPISIDTRKAQVARAALAAGADIVNDVSGLGDPEMADVVRSAGCSAVLMRHEPLQGDPVAACRAQLQHILEEAKVAGIDPGRVIVDPGLGFGDPPGGSVSVNMALVKGVGHYALGHPVLIGASRKRFVGKWAGEEDPARRAAPSVRIAVRAIEAGAAIVRVHDVKETVEALQATALVP